MGCAEIMIAGTYQLREGTHSLGASREMVKYLLR
jgi:hypothetical protein